MTLPYQSLKLIQAWPREREAPIHRVNAGLQRWRKPVRHGGSERVGVPRLRGPEELPNPRNRPRSNSSRKWGKGQSPPPGELW